MHLVWPFHAVVSASSENLHFHAASPKTKRLSSSFVPSAIKWLNSEGSFLLKGGVWEVFGRCSFLSSLFLVLLFELLDVLPELLRLK